MDEEAYEDVSPLEAAADAEETEGESESPLAGLDPVRSELLRQSKAAEERRASLFQTELNRIEKAKQKLLAQPTELSRKEMLRAIASKLTQRPVDQRDPRFWERQNLFTMLRDIGELGGEVSAAEKKLKAEQEAKVSELEGLRSKYMLGEAERGASQAASALARYRPPTTPAARTTELERLLALRQEMKEDDPNFDAINARINLLTTRAPRAEKTEIDPDRPPTVVLNRVSSARDRAIGPVGAKLQAVNQARSLLNAARENPAAVPQVDRYLARLTGDSQLSQLEVNSIANAGGFPQKLVSGISKFLSGIPSDLTLDQKEQVLQIVERQIAPEYNRGRDKVLDTFASASDVSPSVVERIVGPKYIPSYERKPSKVNKPPAGAIEMLKKNPDLAAEFDAKYGAGASKIYLGK